MASASEDEYSDDYNSDEDSEADRTESPKRKSPRRRSPKTVSVKVPSGAGGGGSGRRLSSPSRSRPSSGRSTTGGAGAISHSTGRKSAQEPWHKKKMKNGGTATGHRKNQRNRTAVEAWGDHLRRSGAGISTESKNNTMTGLNKTKAKDMSYASTSHYLRQLMGTEKNRTYKLDPSAPRAAPGTPAYKSQEEYYDEIMDLKKVIAAMNAEQSTMKSKVRRLEEDNFKKEKEIQNLLDPSKSDEMRRTLADGKADSSAVIHSLKQKILKLEQNLREKEAQYSKLQSDMKTTKVEEIKLQLETCYKEILRLSTLKQAGALSARTTREEKVTGPKMKALQDTVLRMNEKNVRLQQENKTLKEDLEKMMEESAQNKARSVEYEDMNKKQLMSAITKLEKKLDKAEVDNTSMMSEMDDRRGKSEGKMALEGTMAQKLTQLDRRETELLSECEKQRTAIKKLKDDRVFYRKKNEEKDKEIRKMKLDVEELQAELDEFYNKDKSRTPRPASSRRSSVKSSPVRSRAGSRSRSPSVSSDVSGMRKADRERHRRAEHLRQHNAARKIQRGWRSHKKDEKKRRVRVKAMALREHHAAKVIQKGWKRHTRRRERQNYEATEVIQSAMRGHLTRKRNLGYLEDRSRGFYANMDSEMEGESDLDNAAEYIQSSVRGYRHHKDHLSRSRKQFLFDDDYDSDILDIQGAFRGHLARKAELRNAQKPPKPYTHRSPNLSRKMTNSRSRLDSAGEEEDEEVSRYSARGKRYSSGGSPRGSIRGKSPSAFSNRSSRRTPTQSHHSDDEDVIDSKRRGSSRGKYY